MEPITMNIPVLALRGLTAFPNETLSFDVERDISIYALDNAMENDRRLFLVTQKEISVADPTEEDLYRVGTICHILQIIKTSENSVRVIVEGEERARLHRMWQGKPFLQANVEVLEEEFPGKITPRVEAMLRRTYALFGAYKELAPQLSDDFIAAVLDCRDTGRLADLIAQNITLRHQDRQRVLEELRPNRRLQIVNDILTHEVDVLSLEMQMEQKVRQRVAQVQKDMILREQVKVLQHELGDDGDEEIAEYTEKIQRAKLPEEVHKRLTKEVERLAKQPFGSAEASVIRNYLDVCLEMPWNRFSRERADVEQARKLLDRDHYGLEKVKERILEFIAVRQLNPDAKGKILCLVGPPGVGKTSVAISVAKAMNRKLARLSLGGVRDEADIRGHRKTYIGAMPGRIIEAISRAGAMNPLLVLDEIDKLGSAGRRTEHIVPRPFSGGAGGSEPRDVHYHGQHHVHHSPPAAGPDGGHRAYQLYRRGEAADRQDPPAAQADEGAWTEKKPAAHQRRRHPRGHHRLHTGVRCPDAGASAGQAVP
ncbi:MAG: hypothetical protein BHW35_01130 [Firmicutes bacterium CAG:176_63_11]|nr:MAG: hypothetical protein BHW35_01130 [Firmicutes bacterium CAG:176_63_11]